MFSFQKRRMQGLHKIENMLILYSVSVITVQCLHCSIHVWFLAFCLVGRIWNMDKHFSNARNKNIQIIFLQQQACLLALSSVSRPETCECEVAQFPTAASFLRIMQQSSSTAAQSQEKMRLVTKKYISNILEPLFALKFKTPKGPTIIFWLNRSNKPRVVVALS